MYLMMMNDVSSRLDQVVEAETFTLFLIGLSLSLCHLFQLTYFSLLLVLVRVRVLELSEIHTGDKTKRCLCRIQVVPPVITSLLFPLQTHQ